jgi:hypothetical protein
MRPSDPMHAKRVAMTEAYVLGVYEPRSPAMAARCRVFGPMTCWV